MSSRRKWTEQVTAVGRQLHDQIRSPRSRLRTGLQRGSTLARPVLALVVVLVVVNGPAIAQPSGNGIVTDTVCNSEISTLASAVFSLLVLALSAFGVFRVGDGFRKYGDPRPDVKRTGIESVKGGMISFAGAIFVLISPQVLTNLGLNFANCIGITGV